MKKSVRLIAVLLVSVMLSALIPFSASAASNLDGKKILFFGDSITALGGSNRYTDLLTSMYPNSTIINAGVSGDSTYNARLRFENDVIAKDPDIVFICLGMNDAAIDTTGTTVKPIATYRKNIRNFITALYEIGADVVLMTPHPVCLATEPGRTSPNYADGEHEAFCDVLRELAMENNCGLLDMYTEFDLNYNSATYIYDGLHQTAAGHKVYADKISAYLNAVYDNVNKAEFIVNYKTERGTYIDSYTYIGAVGANVKLMVPEIEGFTAVSTPTVAALSTTVVDYIYNSELEDALIQVENSDLSEYGKIVASEIESCYGLGKNILVNGTSEEMAATAKRLNYLLTVKGDAALNHALNAKYTVSPEPNYFYGGNDTRFVDDGIRLSDGSKSNLDGENGTGSFYSVWQGTNAEITFDFGKSVYMDTFKAYVADGQMGISRPDQISVSVSEDGSSFTTLSASPVVETIANTETWDTYCFTVSAPEVLSARYVKITLNTVTWGAKCVWVDEVEVLLNDTNYAPEGSEPVEPEPDKEYVLGDINDDGKHTSADYLMLKKVVFGVTDVNSLKSPETASLRCDLNGDGKHTATDYFMLKRLIFS